MERLVTLEYRLADLPGPFYRAGLAGLVVLVDAMESRGIPSPVRELAASTDGAKVSLDREGVQALFDELYDAFFSHGEEAPEVDEGAEQEDGVPGRRVKKKKPVAVPKAAFLEALQCPREAIDIWRQSLYLVVLPKPRMRHPFKERAAGQPVGSSVRSTWDALDTPARPGRPVRVELTSSLLPDAQEHNAEAVPFTASPHLAFLLRFWPVAATFWRPVQLRWDNKLNRHRREIRGRVLAVPDVQDLTGFCRRYRVALSRLVGNELDIAIPEESALRLGSLLATQVGALSLEHGRLYRFVNGFDIWHLERVGNNARVLGRYYIPWHQEAIDAYGRARFAHPLFRGCVVRSLLQRTAPHRLLAHYLTVLPHEQFVEGPKADEWTRYFGQDFRRWLWQIQADSDVEVGDMTAGAEPQSSPWGRPLEVIVRDLVRTYVIRKTEARTGISWEAFRNGQLDGNKAQDFRKRYEKVCEDLFLAVRGRRHRDAFVAYLAETIGSVPQYLPEADLVALNRALQGENWSDVRALVLLATAAVSGLPRETQADGEATR